MLKTYRMAQIMTSVPVTIRPDQPIHRAEQLMNSRGVRHLPVTVESNEIVGMLTERDLRLTAHFRHPDSLRVYDLMKEHPYCVSTDSYAVDALRLMADFKAEAIAVTSGRRTLQGIFTRHDALKLLNRALKLLNRMTEGNASLRLVA